MNDMNGKEGQEGYDDNQRQPNGRIDIIEFYKIIASLHHQSNSESCSVQVDILGHGKNSSSPILVDSTVADFDK